MQFFTSQDINWWIWVVWIFCGLLWCFYQPFGLSFWRHPFTAEHPLQSNWWMLNIIKSDEETNLSTSWMAWVHYQQSFIFGVNYSFNDPKICQSMLSLLTWQCRSPDWRWWQANGPESFSKQRWARQRSADPELERRQNICKPLDLFSVCFQWTPVWCLMQTNKNVWISLH